MKTKTATNIVTTLTLAFTFSIIGLSWATIETALFDGLTCENFVDDFNSEFRPFLPAIFSLAIFIPIVDHRINKTNSQTHSS